MDNSVLSDESDYDVVSNSGGQRSLESSITDFAHCPGQTASEVYEPPLPQAARERFKTACLSVLDIQTYVRRALDSPSFKGNFLPDHDETVRVYVDGAFDAFNAG